MLRNIHALSVCLKFYNGRKHILKISTLSLVIKFSPITVQNNKLQGPLKGRIIKKRDRIKRKTIFDIRLLRQLICINRGVGGCEIKNRTLTSFKLSILAVEWINFSFPFFMEIFSQVNVDFKRDISGLLWTVQINENTRGKNHESHKHLSGTRETPKEKAQNMNS